MVAEPTRYEPYYEVVRLIPEGRVATYGQVAFLAGRPGRARHVGRALRSLPEEHDVPWHRVLNAQGRISQRGLGDSEHLQRILLEGEGVRFSDAGIVSLKRFRWEPRRQRSAGRSAARNGRGEP